MPITFWTFLIGGLALSGFPVITAGFWSKDEILADAFADGQWAVFIILALAAFLTAFYTMRQITLTFLGKPRTEEAEHAQESKWTMTLPLVILAFFGVTIGWVGIPDEFPGLGGIIGNWLHHFVGGTLLEEPATVPFSFVPLTVSILVALGGLFLGWFVYRKVPAGAQDPLAKALGPVYTLLERKYYFDEIYDKLFVKPSYWIAETFSYKWMDRRVIDGILHAMGPISFSIGGFLRNAIDLPIVNGFGDFVGETAKRIGRSIRVIQTGRLQQYMIAALVTIAAFSALFYYLVNRP
jgi:NADH-quinone oxidoreductase subunit L